MKPAVYRCRCFTCKWVGYRRGYFRSFTGPSDVSKRIHVDPCPHCEKETVHGLCPKLEHWWK